MSYSKGVVAFSYLVKPGKYYITDKIPYCQFPCSGYMMHGLEKLFL